MKSSHLAQSASRNNFEAEYLNYMQSDFDKISKPTRNNLSNATEGKGQSYHQIILEPINFGKMAEQKREMRNHHNELGNQFGQKKLNDWRQLYMSRGR